jgi:transglutaminase-like putative cysteine protease
MEVPRLEVGDALEIRVSRVGFNIAYLDETANAKTATPEGSELQPPMPGHWYEVTLFQGEQPIVRKRYSVHLPRTMEIQYEVYNGPVRTSRWLTPTHEIYTFSVDDMAPLKKEPHSVAPDDVAPKVVLATLPDWPAKSRWFQQVNESQFEADDAIRAKVAEITKGMTKLEDKIAACNHWVADNIRYYGTSRGSCEGFTLHKGSETLRDRGGVCKDKAGMVVTMLRVLGVEAYPALTMAGSRVERVPADQFNHTVTVYRNAEGKFAILDPTWVPLSREMWSSREAEQYLVYGTPQGEELTQSPYYPPSYNSLRAKADSIVSAEGDLQTTIVMDMQGYPCTYLRRNVFKQPPGELRAAFEGVMGVAPNARLVEFNNTQPDDYTRDSQVTLKIAAARFAAGGNGLTVVALPMLSHPLGKWLYPDLLEKLADGERQYGYRLRATRGIHYEETMRLPDGWKVDELPPAKDIDTPVALLKFSAKGEGNSVTYTLDFEARQHQVAAEDYPKLREALTALQELADARLICRSADTSQNEKQAAGRTVKSEVAHD